MWKLFKINVITSKIIIVSVENLLASIVDATKMSTYFMDHSFTVHLPTKSEFAHNLC